MYSDNIIIIINNFKMAFNLHVLDRLSDEYNFYTHMQTFSFLIL